MNVSELARRLRINPKKMLEILPEFGFDIGAKAVKIDDRVANQITREWKRINRTLERREQEELEKQKELEKQNRRESGIELVIPNKITIRELAENMNIPVNKLMIELMKNGILASQNENIDFDTASIMAEELGFTVKQKDDVVEDDSNEEHLEGLEKALSEGNKTKRAPVVVVMGHVDHGKTRLLDAIRSANVIAGEAGGITQHIGAYQVNWENKKEKSLSDGSQEKSALTFIDTPGHEAFTVMRSRGAKVADIAILVVAADDGVKPQTLEAIEIIKAAKLPVVVAVNKIDKESADPKRTRTELSGYGIVTDEWGGDVPMVDISAKENINIDKLLDTLLIVADMNEDSIVADANRPAAGTVIEAHVDKGEGPVATVLIQTGTLKVNDPIVINGEIYGKVRAMKDYKGEDLKNAGPSTPIRILGFKVTPSVGDVLDVSSKEGAKNIDVKNKRAEASGAEKHTLVISNDSDDEENKTKALNIVVKTDVLGSLEAIIASLSKIKNDEVQVSIVSKGLGNITADDVARAESSGAVVYGFNVVATPVAQDAMSEKNIEFVQYKIIYDLIDDVTDRLEKLLSAEKITTELGKLEIKAVFRTEKNKTIAGGLVVSGKIWTGEKARVIRGGKIEGVGKIEKLQIGQQVEKKVPEGSECGIEFKGKAQIEKGDIIEVYKEEEKKKELILDK